MKSPSSQIGIGMFLAALALVGATATAPVAAQAQSRNVQALVERVERLERRLVDLERQVYRGGTPPRPAASTAGPAPTRAADVELRLMQLETQIRELTGGLEENDHRNRQLADRYEKFVGDMDFRLKELEAAVARAKQGQPVAATPPGNVSAVSTASSAPTDLTKAPAEGGAAASTGSEARAALPAGTPVEQYKFATGLVRQKAFADAELAFRAFLDAHPNDRLAPNAQYWLGETLYVREKYEDAARVFLAGYQRYPSSSKASDSLLKLGVTLRHLGQRDEACATFDELLRRLPKNEHRLRPKTELEQRNTQCQ